MKPRSIPLLTALAIGFAATAALPWRGEAQPGGFGWPNGSPGVRETEPEPFPNRGYMPPPLPVAPSFPHQYRATSGAIVERVERDGATASNICWDGGFQVLNRGPGEAECVGGRQ